MGVRWVLDRWSNPWFVRLTTLLYKIVMLLGYKFDKFTSVFKKQTFCNARLREALKKSTFLWRLSATVDAGARQPSN
jgi:hypothetical protein